MGDTEREIERTYESPGRDAALPDLTGAGGVAAVLPQGVVERDAVHYDTADLRLAAASLTLCRRPGGGAPGWRLELPVPAAAGARDGIGMPLSDTVPAELAALVRSRTRDAELIPVLRLRSSRDTTRLFDAKNALAAEVSVDTVRARRLGAGGSTAEWTEVGVARGPGAGPALLDAVEKRLRRAGLRRTAPAPTAVRALARTRTATGEPVVGEPAAAVAVSAGDHVLAYLREQADAVVAHDPGVRRGLPDSVHQMRVATRRLRSAFRTYRAFLDRSVTDPVAGELKWLAAELGVDRDHEVLSRRLRTRIDALPADLLLGPVRARLRSWESVRRAGARERTLAVLDSGRYLALLDALLAEPPLRPAAGAPARQALPGRVRKVHARLAGRVGRALALPPGRERDLALHHARKAAKRARYAAEAARPALGRPAGRFAERMKAVQTLLGDHQDSVVAREALRELALQAHAAGESAFTWGLLHGEEAARAERLERELPRLWSKASARKLRAALDG
ncbi:CYTH and CHAD domain-containing protein [Streptomyces sp. NBC_01429]|uniref:CYTH and CHAD domain-containing protein n=1 Tax=Streptomyces sp. NBC_01429 TaxID=2903862 RepID=UPI002E28F3EC|nr:CYTH and CHAD domain-containing protein [Streptomyces sp. NBC_01429]